MEKINIAELLKNCPKGMELDCAMYDNVQFNTVQDENFYPIKIDTPEGRISLTKEGCYSLNPYCKCVIFPKGKTTWDGFIPPFKDGDILFVKSAYSWILIYKESEYKEDLYKYAAIVDHPNRSCIYCDNNNPLCCKNDVSEIRFATEEQKQRLFDAIKANGYKWNPQEKTLEKLCPFNAGDVLVTGVGNILFSHIDDEQVIYYHCILSTLGSIRIAEETDCGVGKVHHCKLATDKQRDILFDRLQKSGYKYNPQTNKLEKLIEPKFKVGDRIKHIYGHFQYIVKELTNTHYAIVEVEHKFKYTLPIIEDEEWKLVPDKFDITTLKPFESRVLVRTANGKWVAAFYSHYDKDSLLKHCVVGGLWYEQCIPYNDETKHLLDTTDNCYDYYKTWE